MLRPSALLIVVLALPAPARADKEADAIRLLDEGYDLFKKGDEASLAAARRSFEAARLLFPEKANPYRLLALTDVRLGRCDEAMGHLDTFLRLIKPDDPRFAEAVTIRDQCREKLATLVVDSTPPGADVRLDKPENTPVGITPFRSEAVLVGPRKVLVGKPGFAPWVKEITLEARGTVNLSAALVAATVAAPVTPAPVDGRRRMLLIAVVAVAAVAVLAGVGIGLGIALQGGGSNGFLSAMRLPEVRGN